MAVNKCIFIGRLTDDPSVRYMPNGDPVANFSIAVNEKYKDKSGEQREKTEYIRVVAYRRTAEIIGQYTRKGSKLYVEGKLQTRKWSDKNGQDHYTTEIIADQMQMLGSKEDRGQRERQSEKPGRFPDPPPNPSPQTFDDDMIPF